ncbi:hypothetical protein MHYP_G00084980 [Metynnis hypsauchen]
MLFKAILLIYHTLYRHFSALTGPGRRRIHACNSVELKHFDHHRVESSRPQAEHLFLRAEGGQGDDHRCSRTGVHHPQIQKVIGGPRITVPLYKERRGRRGFYGYDDTAFCCRERGAKFEVLKCASRRSGSIFNPLFS